MGTVPAEIWAARLDRQLTAREARELAGLLPPDRRERLLRLRREELRREPLCAYLLLRRALWEKYAWTELPAMGRSPGGKPYFPEFPEVFFNLSHTDGAVLAALAGCPVGVDVQRFRPVSRRMLQRLAAGGGEAGFFPDWVRREALAKCRGVGISALLAEAPDLLPGERFEPLELFPGYAAGIAVQGGEISGRIHLCALAELLDWAEQKDGRG